MTSLSVFAVRATIHKSFGNRLFKGTRAKTNGTSGGPLSFWSIGDFSQEGSS
jgi:hypothetical protein